MAKTDVKKVIKVAKKYIGYLEKKSNTSLDDFTKNAGKKNYNKFAVEFKKFTGLNLQAQPWCDIWVDSIFVEAYGVNKAKKLLGGFSAYTPTSANYFKNTKRWFTSNPQVGDVIFFKNSERINHTGIIVGVSDTKVYTIEGNTSSGSAVIENGGGVFAKSYYLSNKRIAGYGRPNYDIVDFYIYKPSSEWIGRLQSTLNKLGHRDKNGNKLTVDKKAGKLTKSACPSLKKGVKNELVGLAQERLLELGFDPNGIDNSFGNGVGKAVVEMKKVIMGSKNPTTTIGNLSWDVLLGRYEK